MPQVGFYTNLHLSQFKGKGPGGEVSTSGFVSTHRREATEQEHRFQGTDRQAYDVWSSPPWRRHAVRPLTR